MNRRDFLQLVSTGLAAGAASTRVPLIAQQQSARPKIMLFGLTAVMKGEGPGIGAVLPAVTNHGAFICGPTALVAKLANGNTLMSGPNSGLKQGHPQLGLPGTSLVCLGSRPVTAGSGAASFETGLGNHLPNVPRLADEMQTGVRHAFGPYPAGTIPMTLNGGVIRMPSVPSTNVGTHGVPWQFEHEGKSVGGEYALTDLLVFESNTQTMDISIGPSRATLSASDVLWFVNIPTFAMKDETKLKIEHAQDWFSFLNARVDGTIVAVAKKPFDRPTTGTKIEHPCLGAEPRLSVQIGADEKYFPPDTDPCFIVMA